MSNTYQEKSRRGQAGPAPVEVAVSEQVIVSARRYEHGLEPAGAAVADAASAPSKSAVSRRPSASGVLRPAEPVRELSIEQVNDRLDPLAKAR